LKKTICFFFLLAFSFGIFAGDYCVFPFENKGGKSLNYLKYGFEVYFETVFNSKMCERIEAMEEIDLPPAGNFTYATQIEVAKQMDARYLVNGSFEGSEENLKLTVRVFDVDSSVKEYFFEGSVEKLLNQTLKDFALKFENSRWPFGTIKVEEFKKFSLALSLLCIYKDASLCKSFKDSFAQNSFYSETVFDALYEYENYTLAEDFFKLLKNPDSEDFLKMGMIKVKEGNFKEAEKFFKEGNKLNPDDIFLNNLAGCFLFERDFPSAAKVFPFSNKNGVYLLNGALIFCAVGSYDDAVDLLKKFSLTYGLTDEAGSILVFILEKKNVNVSFFKNRFSSDEVFSNYIFLDEKDFDFEKLNGDIENYRKKYFECLDKDRKKAKGYLMKLVSIYPFDKEALKTLCYDFQIEDFCKLLKFLGE